jgi:hypothetical protein
LESFGDELVPGKGFALYIEKKRSKRAIQMLRKYCLYTKLGIKNVTNFSEVCKK